MVNLRQTVLQGTKFIDLFTSNIFGKMYITGKSWNNSFANTVHSLFRY